jgi:hypothetical protein
LAAASVALIASASAADASTRYSTPLLVLLFKVFHMNDGARGKKKLFPPNEIIKARVNYTSLSPEIFKFHYSIPYFQKSHFPHIN